jgi:hypothetical protein
VALLPAAFEFDFDFDREGHGFSRAAKLPQKGNLLFSRPSKILSRGKTRPFPSNSPPSLEK